MAEATAVPATACLCCRRRKLKCSREPAGCSACQKAALPCIYPITETGAKRKRGPYKKKDKPARQAHLDHVVKYLSNPVSYRESLYGTLGQEAQTDIQEPPAPEELVKDALTALTNTQVPDPGPADSLVKFENLTKYQYLLAWHLFRVRVDPMTKLLLCNETEPLFYLYTEGHRFRLGHSICYAAVSSCTAEECLSMFGISKIILQKHFRTHIQRDLLEDHGQPQLETMQALTLYLVCVCREELETNTWTLFSLVVRNAQLMDMHKDPVNVGPVEAEIRRRLWWTICSLESRCSEEGSRRTSSLLTTVAVKLPLNFNDDDLPFSITQLAKPRSGLTSMSYLLVRWHIMRLTSYIVGKQKSHKANPRTTEKVFRMRLGRELERVVKLLHDEFLVHCHPSRPLDHMIMVVAEIMLIKCRLLIDIPDQSTAPEHLSPSQRFTQLILSVKIIRNTYGIMSDQQAAIYTWFFRSYLQWHSLAVVIAEIGKSDDPAFIRSAWEAVQPFVEIWHRIFKRREDDSTWQHVDGLIRRAQQVAEDKLDKNHTVQPVFSEVGSTLNCTEGLLPFTSAVELTPPQAIEEWQKAYESDLASSFSSEYDPDLLMSGGEMFDPMLDIPGLNGTTPTDLDVLNAVFAESDWDFGFDSMGVV